jgi:hypothetical protein
VCTSCFDGQKWKPLYQPVEGPWLGGFGTAPTGNVELRHNRLFWCGWRFQISALFNFNPKILRRVSSKMGSDNHSISSKAFSFNPPLSPPPIWVYPKLEYPKIWRR